MEFLPTNLTNPDPGSLRQSPMRHIIPIRLQTNPDKCTEQKRALASPIYSGRKTHPSRYAQDRTTNSHTGMELLRKYLSYKAPAARNSMHTIPCLYFQGKESSNPRMANPELSIAIPVKASTTEQPT